MEPLYKSGKYFFAFSMIAFGFIQLNHEDFMSGFLPVSTTFPERAFFLYLTSSLFILGGIGMCVPQTTKTAARVMGLFLLILFIYPHLVQLATDIHNPGPWTGASENLALAAGALIIAAGAPRFSATNGAHVQNHELFVAGKWMLALSLLVVAVQHFMYADFISKLITAWIPFKVFFAYFVGVAFLLGAVSLFTNIKTRLACILLGFMFLFWVIFLHLPRVAADTHVEAEKTSMFIAFAYCGIFFVIASYLPGKRIIKR